MGLFKKVEKNQIEDGVKKEDEIVKVVPLLKLFRFADKIDILFMIVGLICACIHGAALPCMIIVFGDMTNSFIVGAQSGMSFCTVINSSRIPSNITNSSIQGINVFDAISKSASYYAIIGVIVILIAYIEISSWLITSYRQTFKIRSALLGSILKQDMGWFDTSDSGELNTRMADDVSKIQEGLGDKISNFFMWTSQFVAGVIIGFIYGWKLALVAISLSPLLAIAAGVMTRLLTSTTNKELTAYAKAGAVAEEVFTAIRTVVAFHGQKKECERYGKNLVEAKKFGIKKGMYSGAGMGMVFLILFSSYAVAFWYGGKLVRECSIQVGDMLIVFFSVIIGAMALGNAGPNLQAIGIARGAAYTIWNLIDRKSKIDSSSNEGLKISSVIGNISFNNVYFNYPSRHDIPILKGLTLNVKCGQTVALVGSSGCGKSTAIQLLQRFYDPDSGSISIDGVDIKTLNVKWLRQHMAVVSQEPILFGTTIEENISYGREGVARDEIINAAKEANAHDFITALPLKYKTLVGERGSQLSGGQKQRIAIARALVRNPKILLLDEATSALDTESEATVQSALDKARQGRTTFIVAHRLSTIRTADIIFGLKDGIVHEFGTHDQLMEMGGIYYQLVTNQKVRHNDEEDDDEEADMDMYQLKREDRLSLVRNGSMRSGRGRLTSTGSIKSRKGRSFSKTDDDVEIVDLKEEDEAPQVSLFKVFKYNSKEWYLILIGSLSAMIHGAVHPSFSIIFAKFIGIFGNTLDPVKIEQQVLLYSMLFFAVAGVAGVTMFIQGAMFALSGERLTMRMRKLTFYQILLQNISYFDDHKNSVGALTTRLSKDASAMQGVTGLRIGLMMEILASVGVGIIIGFVYSWQLTLLILACIPIIVLSQALKMRLSKGFSGKGKDTLEEAGKIATETISNMRTVASLTTEEKFLQIYKDLIYLPHKKNIYKAHFYAISYSFSQSMIFFIYAAVFVLGAYLIEANKLDYESMFIVFGAIIFSAMQAGRSSQFAPDFAKAKASTNRVFQILNSHPSIDPSSDKGLKLDKCDGSVEFKNVKFHYPTRPSVMVLKNLNLEVKKGSTIALVGSSGCGKSTTVQLLERFYDTLDGNIYIDGNDITELNLSWLRSQMGIVSQEPILFDCSIRENIAYGDNSREVSMFEIQEAAKKANIASFIESLPNGYETSVGDKGTQMSGGQKQRIAIARALLRNPKILLLDEATSALDTESEKIVQEALNRAQEGRTSIVIAHRLSTIQNASCIFVFHNGVIVEQGTHDQLMSLKGKYYKLNMTQMKKH